MGDMKHLTPAQIGALGAARPGDDLPEIDYKGETLRLGTLLPPQYPATLPRLSAAPGFRVWTRAEIEDAVRNKPVKRRQQFRPDAGWILNQKQRGSCNAAGGAGALRRAMVLSGRNDVPQLSWEFLYAQINGGADNGSALADGMQAITEVGIPPLDAQRHPINRDILKRDYSPEEYAAAKAYTAERCYQVHDELELATLLLSGQGAGVVAVHVGSRFTAMDASGYAGADGGPGNHAVCVHDVEIIGGELAFDHAGSWGTGMHADGYAYLSWRRHFAQTIRYHAFYAVVASSNSGQGAPTAA